MVKNYKLTSRQHKFNKALMRNIKRLLIKKDEARQIKSYLWTILKNFFAQTYTFE
jgi:hypothetical protein